MICQSVALNRAVVVAQNLFIDLGVLSGRKRGFDFDIIPAQHLVVVGMSQFVHDDIRVLGPLLRINQGITVGDMDVTLKRRPRICEGDS